MGCFWSDQDHERCRSCNRKAVNNLIIINEVCEVCNDRQQRENFDIPRNCYRKVQVGPPYFGEYKCKGCNRFWNSRLCWPNSYQMCKRCRRPVYANYFRPLQSADISFDKDKEHAKDLCQKCKELGHYCGTKQSFSTTRKKL